MNEKRFKQLLDAQAATLASQLTARLDKRFDEQEVRLTKRLDERLNDQLATFFGQMSRYFDKRFAEQDAKLESFDVRLDRLQITLDGLVKRQETDDHERIALSSKVDRHEGWIKQLAAKTGSQLSPE
jgi:hypothetical protein